MISCDTLRTRGFLKDCIVPKLEQAWIDLELSRAKEEERSQDLEREREARKKAENAAANKDAEIEALKRVFADILTDDKGLIICQGV